MAYKINGNNITINGVDIPFSLAVNLSTAIPDKNRIGAGVVIYNSLVEDRLQRAGVIVTEKGLSRPGPAYDDLVDGLSEMFKQASSYRKHRFNIGDTVLIDEKFVRWNRHGDAVVVTCFPEDVDLGRYFPSRPTSTANAVIIAPVVEVVIADAYHTQDNAPVYSVHIGGGDNPNRLTVSESVLLIAQHRQKR